MERYNYRYSSPAGTSTGSVISPQATKSVANAYVKVMNEVCATVRDTFLDEGVEISVLQELRRLWEYKLHQSKVLESNRPFAGNEISRNTNAVYGNVYGTPANAGHPTLHIPAGTRVESFGESAGVNAPSSQIFQLASSSNQLITPQAISGARLPANARIISGVNMPTNLPPGSTVRVLRAPIQQHNIVSAGGGGAGNVSNIVSATSGGGTTTASYASDNSNTLPAGEFVQIDGARPVISFEQECQTVQRTVQSANSPSATAAVGTALPGVAELFLQLDGQGALNDSDEDDDSDDDFQDDIPQRAPKSQKLSSPNKSRVVPKSEPSDAPPVGDDDDGDDDSSDDSDDLDGKLKSETQDEDGEDEEPLNSEDDVTDDEASTFAAGEDVVVCQYEKVRRQKNRWNLVLKDGIMNVQGRDVLFHRAEVLCDW